MKSNDINNNDKYKVVITNEDQKGNGITRIDNVVTFVKGTFINEEVEIEIIRKEKRFLVGKLINIIKSSKKRKEIKCPHFYECGGCSFLHLDIHEELICKKKQLSNIFSNENIKDIINDKEYHYRNKVTFHVKESKIGYFREKSNELVEIKECFLLNKNITKIINKIKGFDLSNITKIMVRVAINNNELMICFYGKINDKDLIKLISFKEITSIYENDNFIYGKEYITEIINNKIYTIYPNSFFQVNTKAMTILYELIKNSVNKKGRLLDLYSGTGTIALYLSDKMEDILGIEIIKDAIKNANLNKKLNKVNNVNFKCMDSSKVVNKKFDTIIVDPPRSGLSKTVINNIIKMKPKELVYVSCNPLTLKRDLKLLEEVFIVKEITPINMFPRTDNIECVTLLNIK